MRWHKTKFKRLIKCKCVHNTRFTYGVCILYSDYKNKYFKSVSVSSQYIFIFWLFLIGLFGKFQFGKQISLSYATRGSQMLLIVFQEQQTTISLHLGCLKRIIKRVFLWEIRYDAWWETQKEVRFEK